MKNRLFICCITLVLIITSTTLCFASPRDIRHHWCKDIANTLLENKIITGYSDGSFSPDSFITREEFCVLLVSFGKQQGLITEEALQNELTTENIEDVNATWSKIPIKYLIHKGIALLDEDNLFNPNKLLNRQDMAQMLYNYKINFEGYTFQESFYDLESYPTDISQNPSETAIKALYGEGIINGYKDKTFKPENHITRAELCTALYKMSGLELIPLTTTTASRYNLIDVPYISQLYPVNAPVGCEGTSLLMGLKSKGYATDMDLKTFLDYMPKDLQNPSRGFVGSPYKADHTKLTRTTIYPAKLAEYGKCYGKVFDISGSSATDIQTELLMGNPVIVYATLYWEKPFYRNYSIDNQQLKLLSNNHVILVSGYNADKNEYFICDPYNKKSPQTELKYWIDGATFEKIYNERKHAAVVE